MNVIDTVIRGKESTYMKTFTIDSEDNISAFATPEAAATTATPFDTFASQKELFSLVGKYQCQLDGSDSQTQSGCDLRNDDKPQAQDLSSVLTFGITVTYSGQAA